MHAAFFLSLGLLLAPPPDSPDRGVVEATRVRAALENILVAPEYRHLRQTKTPPPPPAPSHERTQPRNKPAPTNDANRGAGPSLDRALPAIRILVYAILAGVVLIVASLLVRRLKHSSPAAAALPPTPLVTEEPRPDALDGDDFLRRALAQASGGRHPEAIRLLLMGALAFIENSGHIRRRPGLTNGDYLRAVARQPSLRGALEPIVDAFDEIHFGRRGAGADRFDTCLRAYRSAFGR